MKKATVFLIQSRFSKLRAEEASKWSRAVEKPRDSRLMESGVLYFGDGFMCWYKEGRFQRIHKGISFRKTG